MPTMFEQIWNRHVVTEGPGGQSLLYIDRHLLHEGATHAFARLHRAGRSVRRPAGLVATADHYVREFGLPASVAQMVMQRVQAKVAADELTAQVDEPLPPGLEGASASSASGGFPEPAADGA